MGGGTGGEGLSVCVGDLPEAPFDELGAGDGLRVLLLSGAEALEVHYANALVLRSGLARERVRAGREQPFRLTYGRSGLGVQLNGSWLVRDLVIGGWSPLASWRFGVGARTGEGRTDEHRLDNMRLVVAAVESRASVLEVGPRQFSSSGIPFVYNAHPVVSSFFPREGR